MADSVTKTARECADGVDFCGQSCRRGGRTLAPPHARTSISFPNLNFITPAHILLVQPLITWRSELRYLSVLNSPVGERGALGADIEIASRMPSCRPTLCAELEAEKGSEAAETTLHSDLQSGL